MKSNSPGRQNSTPFNHLIERFDAHIGSVIVERNRWRLVALISLSFLLISLGGWYWSMTLPRTAPMVIEVSPWGEAKYVGNIGEMSYSSIKIPPAAMVYKLESFVKNLVTVPNDRVLLDQFIKANYTSVTTAGKERLTTFYRKDLPYNKIGVNTCYPEIESTIKITDNTYQVDWILRVYGSNSKMLSETRFRGLFTLQILTPPEDQLKLNPLGIYIDDFNIAEIRM